MQKTLVVEFLSSLLYAAKSNQLFRFVFLLISEITLRSFRKRLPNEIIKLSLLSTSKDITHKFERYEKLNECPKQGDYIITLAGKSHKLSFSNIWEFPWSDLEEINALHRFGWLLVQEATKSANMENTIGVFCIIDWINSHQKVEGIGWDSYSISERVSNWTIFLNSPCKLDEYQNTYIKKSIEIQLSILLNNLELRGGATNNHIINNGRALYLGGTYFGFDNYIKSGKKILIDSIDLMFSQTGFLREGSSHYQLLITRSYLEALYFAKQFSDKDFEVVLGNKTKNIWKGACFFLEEEELPIFGDVSPDYSINFHRGVGFLGEVLWGEKSDALVPKNAAWHSLFNTSNYSKKTQSQPMGLNNNHDAGYCRYRNDNFSLYIYTNPEGYVAPWSHGHSDIGHFILYVKGEPLLIGTGRMDYKNTEKSNYGRSVRSHNSLEFDSREPMVVHGLNGYPELMLKDYYYNKSDMRVFDIDSECIIQIIHNGYKRLFSDLSITRTIRIEKNKVTLEDSIKGEKKHNISSYFHFSPQTKIYKKSNELYSMKVNQVNIDFSFSSTSNLSDKYYSDGEYYGNHFPDYGVRLPSSTIAFSQPEVRTLKNIYVFHLNG
jgi:hypothetical protein